MIALIIFIFISILVISALLFFNKGKKAQEIKSILKDIYENCKETCGCGMYIAKSTYK